MLCSDFKNDLGKDIMAAEEGIASEAVGINRVWTKCRPEKEVTKCVCVRVSGRLESSQQIAK